MSDYLHLLTPATLAAMAGALVGNVLLKKITLRFVQLLVACMLFLIALALGFGFL
jgi:putative Ca2+/H+ antiporter (TMEM165/GDT1 family)